MAILVFTNPQLVVNGVDLSNHVADVTLDISIASVEMTAMGATGKAYLAGLYEGKIDATFWQDFAAGSVDATLSAIWTAGTAVAFSLIGSGTTPSSTNPRYSGSMVMSDYPPMSGAVGSGLSTKASFVTTGAITRGSV